MDRELNHTDYAEGMKLAIRVHGETARRDGQPYLTHCVWVSEQQDTLFGKILGLIHDTYEDTDEPETIKRLILEKFGRRMWEAVYSLSRREGETYKEFIIRSSRNPDARPVKMADLAHNLSGDPKFRSESLTERYIWASAYITKEWVNDND